MKKSFLSHVIFLVALVFLANFSNGQSDFKADQKRYPRVRTAYSENYDQIKRDLKLVGIEIDQLEVYLRIFKYEKELELWGREQSSGAFQKLKTYTVCATSGALGPKREQGDRQIPEGYYHINRFNPSSNYYLSMGINYPNCSDRTLGVQHNLGGAIFIHGDCVTIGCIPLTDEWIKELYVYCVEAKNNGQQTIPVTLFPARLTDAKWRILKHEFKSNTEYIHLWSDLKKGFDLFNTSKTLPTIRFLESGRYAVE